MHFAFLPVIESTKIIVIRHALSSNFSRGYYKITPIPRPSLIRHVTGGETVQFENQRDDVYKGVFESQVAGVG